ncbi:recombinase family protein [Ornithinimicrobium cryptoxanthini]|uniref:recombinase family protein n=1 Tax=Ornithinimicrobium cryptoxanthini TaxID=2934161 RepID=UPI002118E631|nr:recombinase family protein [Ornithinimicrobium cryptoxanthini]
MVGQTVGYLRVSSQDQNLARQEEAIGQVDRCFIDKASGKGRAERPGLTELLGWVREGDTIHVASMDRLARSIVDLHQIVDEITATGVTVQFLKEGLSFSPDRSDPTARLLLGVMGAVAEFERAIIRERQAEGISAAKARGVYKGRARKLTPAQVDEARQRVTMGVPKAVIARELGCSRQTLHTALA